jgi:hypothetical protein
MIRILLPGHCSDAQLQICPLPFEFRQFVDAAEVKGFCHTYLNTPRIAPAQIAFGSHPLLAIELNTAERAGRDTHAASDTPIFINHDSMGTGVSTERSGRTHLHT